jgi:hypothetical protein
MQIDERVQTIDSRVAFKCARKVKKSKKERKKEEKRDQILI